MKFYYGVLIITALVLMPILYVFNKTNNKEITDTKNHFNRGDIVYHKLNNKRGLVLYEDLWISKIYRVRFESSFNNDGTIFIDVSCYEEELIKDTTK